MEEGDACNIRVEAGKPALLQRLENAVEFPAPRPEELLDRWILQNQITLLCALLGDQAVQQALALIDNGKIIVDDPVGEVVELPEAEDGVGAGKHGQEGHREIAQQQLAVNRQLHPIYPAQDSGYPHLGVKF